MHDEHEDKIIEEVLDTEVEVQGDEPTVEDTKVEDIETKEPVVEVEVPKFETIEEYNKLIQSTSSKAKGEILKEIGLGSVAEIKEHISKADTVQTIVDELALAKSELEVLRAEKSRMEDLSLLDKIGIAPEFGDTFLGLVKNDTSGRPREEVALELKNAFITGKMFTDVQPNIKLGNGKTQEISNLEDILEAMTKL